MRYDVDRLNQQHGIWFEDLVRAKNGCLGIPRIDGPFDVPGVYNKDGGLNVSVKTVRKTTTGRIASVGLASAPRFAAINEDYQLIVGIHTPVNDGKLFGEVRTYEVTKKFHKKLLGGLTAELLLQFDAMIKAHRRSERGDVLARDYALKTRELLLTKYGNRPLVELAYKINGDNRRLQLQVDLEHLAPALSRVDTTNYRGTRLPLFYSPGA